VSTVDFIRVVSTVVVAITQVSFWNTQSAGLTLELTWAASCNTSAHPSSSSVHHLFHLLILPWHFTEIKRSLITRYSVVALDLRRFTMFCFATVWSQPCLSGTSCNSLHRIPNFCTQWRTM